MNAPALNLEISALRLRQLWSFIEATQASFLLQLGDRELVDWLLQQFEQEQSLDSTQSRALRGYLCSRSLLIRDLAQARLAVDLR